MPSFSYYPHSIDQCNWYDMNKKLCCFICADEPPEFWKNHFNTQQHKVILPYFNKHFTKVKFLGYQCNICAKIVVKASIRDHASEHKLFPWYLQPTSREESEKLYPNFVQKCQKGKNEIGYYCHLCKRYFKFLFLAYIHVDDVEHQSKLKLNNVLITGRPTKKNDNRYFFRHSVFCKGNLLVCMICDCAFCNKSFAAEHISLKTHQNNLKNFCVNECKDSPNMLASNNNSPAAHNKNLHSKHHFKNFLPPFANRVKNAPVYFSTVKHESNVQQPLANGFKSAPVNSSTVQLENNVQKPLANGVKNVPTYASTLQNEKPLNNRVNSEAKPRKIIKARRRAKNNRKHPEKSIPVSHEVKEFWIKKSKNDKLVNDNAINVICEFSSCRKKHRGYINLHKHQTIHFIDDFPEVKVEKEKIDVKKMVNDLYNAACENENKSNNNDKQSNLNSIDELISKLKFETSNSNFIELYNEKPQTAKITSKEEIIERIDMNEGEIVDLDIYKISEDQLKVISDSFKLSICLNDVIYCLACRDECKNSIEGFLEHISSVLHLGYLKLMSEDHLKFTKYPNEYSDWTLGLESIEDISEEEVECHGCDKIIPNKIVDIEAHIQEESHRNQMMEAQLESQKLKESLISNIQRDWYNVQIYWCIPCSKKEVTERKFLKHLKQKEHVRICQQYQEFEEMVFDFCPTCGALFYGFRNAYSFHSECKMHKFMKENKFYAPYEMPEEANNFSFNAEEMIDSIILNLDKNIKVEEEKAQTIKKDLETVARKAYPNAQVHFFGSRVSGLATANSDFDAFIDCSGMDYFKENNDVLKSIRTLEMKIKEDEETWRIHRTILDSRVPIIIVQHKQTESECDLSFKNGITTENSLLLNAFIKKFPLCRKLILFLKEWMNISNPAEKNRSFSSYALALMVVFYLQIKGILPKIVDLLSKKSRLISYWETGVNLDFDVPECDLDFNDLAIGFFKMYSSFDFRNLIICPLLGEPVKRKDFINPENLPDAMKSYKNYAKMIKNNSAVIFRIDSPLGIQDPFDLSNNVTRSVKKISLYKFKTCCAISAQLLLSKRWFN